MTRIDVTVHVGDKNYDLHQFTSVNDLRGDHRAASDFIAGIARELTRLVRDIRQGEPPLVQRSGKVTTALEYLEGQIKDAALNPGLKLEAAREILRFAATQPPTES